MWSSLVARFERLGLQRRIMLYVSAGLVAFSAIFGFVALQAIRQSTDLVFRERLLIARTVAHEIDDDLDHFEREIEDASLLVTPLLVANNVANAETPLRTLCNHWTQLDGFNGPCFIWLTSPNGFVLWSASPDTHFSARDLSQLPDFRVAFESQHLTISNGSSPDGSARPTVVFANPLRDGTRVIGFLIGEVDRAQLESWMEPSLGVVQGGYAVEVIDDQGQIITTNERGKPLSMSPHLELVASLWQDGQPGLRNHLVQVDAVEQNHVVAFAPLSRIRWGAVVEQQADAALALPRNLGIQFLLLGGLALLGGLVLAWVTTNTIVHPVQRLIQASEQIAQGDLDHPLDVSGGDEVGTLARRFDQMRVALRESREQIANWNHELEGRVQQRTSELAALVESAHALTSTLDLDALFEILMKETREVLPATEGVALFLFEPEAQSLVVRSTFGFDATECLYLHFRENESIAGKVFEAKTPARLRTITQVQSAMANLSDENRAHFLRAVGDRPVQSAMGVPLVSKDNRLGALTLYNFTHEDAFGERDILILQALADQAATAIENARLYQEASEVGALRELNRLKSEFVARASHELRTPMTAIKSLAESLLRRDLNLDPPTQREFLEGIDAAADRLGGIVEQLLTLSRIEAGKLQIRREPIEVGAILARVVAQFRAQAPTREIDVYVADELPRVLGDTERVEDVLTNLISNALKYSDDCIRIHAHAHDRALVVSVADHGIVIPPEERDRIFERFYRVDNPLTRRVGGAGLGLHICKTYVEAMGGTIEVGNNDGRGSVFRVTLLAVKDED